MPDAASSDRISALRPEGAHAFLDLAAIAHEGVVAGVVAAIPVGAPLGVFIAAIAAVIIGGGVIVPPRLVIPPATVEEDEVAVAVAETLVISVVEPGVAAVEAVEAAMVAAEPVTPEVAGIGRGE